MNNFLLIFAAFFLVFTQNTSAQTVQGSIQQSSDPNGVLVVANPSTDLNNVRFSNFSVAISIPHQTTTPTATIISNGLPHVNWLQITDLNFKGRDYYIFLGTIDVNNLTTVTWNAGQDNPVLNIQFSNGAGNTVVQLDDLTADNGGVTQQAYWYVELLGTGDVTNYNTPFYASVGSGAATNNAGANSFVPTSGLISLPLELIAFNADKKAGKFVRLSWSTSNEIRFSHFEIERSPDGFAWTTLGSTAAKNHPGERTDYSFDDLQPYGGQNFYRLGMLDKDGRKAHSGVRTVHFDQSTSLSIAPNPSDGLVHLTWHTDEPEAEREIQLFDATGRLILIRTTENNTVSIDLAGIAAGAYWLRVNTGSQTSSYRIIRL